MGLLEQEIKEIRQLQKNFTSGMISHDSAITQLAFYNQTEKRAKLILQSFALGAKFGKTTLNRITKTNLIGDGVVIEAGDMGDELIQCPDMERFISRDICFDFSGSHHEECAGCENNTTTKNIILGVAGGNK